MSKKVFNSVVYMKTDYYLLMILERNETEVPSDIDFVYEDAAALHRSGKAVFYKQNNKGLLFYKEV